MNKILSNFFLKSKGPPYESKKNFDSDLDETQNFWSLWPWDLTYKILAKSETKIFFT